MGPVRQAQAWGHGWAWQGPSRPSLSSPTGAPSILSPSPRPRHHRILRGHCANRDALCTGPGSLGFTPVPTWSPLAFAREKQVPRPQTVLECSGNPCLRAEPPAVPAVELGWNLSWNPGLSDLRGLDCKSFREQTSTSGSWATLVVMSLLRAAAVSSAEHSQRQLRLVEPSRSLRTLLAGRNCGQRPETHRPGLLDLSGP